MSSIKFEDRKYQYLKQGSSSVYHSKTMIDRISWKMGNVRYNNKFYKI